MPDGTGFRLKGRADVELVDLRYFVSIAETGSFTKSALQNNIAQSALSRRVRDLEADLGVQLFYRNGRGVLLTEVGVGFWPIWRACGRKWCEAQACWRAR
jgi:DNA-binding transcriptional LysR family regulator